MACYKLEPHKGAKPLKHEVTNFHKAYNDNKHTTVSTNLITVGVTQVKHVGRLPHSHPTQRNNRKQGFKEQITTFLSRTEPVTSNQVNRHQSRGVHLLDLAP